ncbi:MAG: hypothetical protein C0617_05550 [Desulfuromonas sp.]|uniref:hypothetical protein n=1 Tax=Desulfuromonas sp. TaxID=892 RepID=UPI000CC16A29|nr:hypothetical protein [Desulfuromonas sp.]PLX85149.1 MAG: hypothetical protein C0617_05550 [Desulfuromonas sp.]
MNKDTQNGDRELFEQESFEVRDLQDEIRVDGLCERLLNLFYADQVQQSGLQPEEASVLAYGASYFLKEFVVPALRENIYALKPGRVRQFAGNWYIVKNMEPNMAELKGILEGVEAFYEFAHRAGRVPAELLEAIRRDCADLDYYRGRIEDFWNIGDGGYPEWERQCSLKG